MHLNEYAENGFFENIINFIFPVQGKNYPLLAQLVTAFIFHEHFIVSKINPNSPLYYSAYFQIAKTDINRFSYVQTSLPQEKFGCPPLTGIPIHCALLNTLLEIQAKQAELPQDIFNTFIKKMDLSKVGDGQFVNSAILDKLEQLTNKFEVRINKMDSSQQEQEVPVFHESRVFQLTTAALDVTQTDSSAKTTGSTLLFPTIGIWTHYWTDKVCQVSKNFIIPKAKTLVSLWRSWHVPDFVSKVYP